MYPRSRSEHHWFKIVYSSQFHCVWSVCITGQFWLTGHVRVTSDDITSTADDVTVDIGLRVGLRDINISLTGQLLRFTRYILIKNLTLVVNLLSVYLLYFQLLLTTWITMKASAYDKVHSNVYLMYVLNEIKMLSI